MCALVLAWIHVVLSVRKDGKTDEKEQKDEATSKILPKDKRKAAEKTEKSGNAKMQKITIEDVGVISSSSHTQTRPPPVVVAASQNLPVTAVTDDSTLPLQLLEPNLDLPSMIGSQRQDRGAPDTSTVAALASDVITLSSHSRTQSSVFYSTFQC